MNNIAVHFSSKTDNWSTPQAIFDTLNKEFNFSLDVCASSENNKCDAYYTKEIDGLSQPWSGVCWCNPPYGRNIKLWVEKAAVTAALGLATVVCLLPARTDTRWWHDFVIEQSTDVRFIKGRLKFGEYKTSAPFPSAIVVFQNQRS